MPALAGRLDNAGNILYFLLDIAEITAIIQLVDIHCMGRSAPKGTMQTLATARAPWAVCVPGRPRPGPTTRAGDYLERAYAPIRPPGDRKYFKKRTQRTHSRIANCLCNNTLSLRGLCPPPGLSTASPPHPVKCKCLNNRAIWLFCHEGRGERVHNGRPGQPGPSSPRPQGQFGDPLG